MTVSKKVRKLKPFIKWPGGKTRELRQIIPYLPSQIHHFHEPFVGGGAVYFAVEEAKRFFINDKSTDLIDLYQQVKLARSSDFLFALEAIDESWRAIEQFFQQQQEPLAFLFYEFRSVSKSEKNLYRAIRKWIAANEGAIHQVISHPFYVVPHIFIKEINTNLFRKLVRMQALEATKSNLSGEDVLRNILTALKSSVYTYFRHLFNYSSQFDLKPYQETAIYYFIRNFAYSSMFRYNKRGDFNVCYGGMGYNRNSLKKKIAYLKTAALQEKLGKTSIENLDFFDFLNKQAFNPNDFIFLDPPYDTEFNTYDKHLFTKKDQERLAFFLIRKTNCKWMLVIKNTDFIHQLYDRKGIFINHFDKMYAMSFMNRNERATEHLMITNYDINRK